MLAHIGKIAKLAGGLHCIARAFGATNATDRAQARRTVCLCVCASVCVCEREGGGGGGD